jgi:pimeloyl-ACP methyl ester carboxylesterase
VEPVVLVHAGVFADWFKPLLEEPALTGRHRVVRYHRFGYAGSSRVAGAVSIAEQAAHLRALMRHLGIKQAHIVGHSSSGNIALQLALMPRTWCSRSPS